MAERRQQEDAHAERAAAIQDSEAELLRRHSQMKRDLEEQARKLDEKRRQFDEERKRFEAVRHCCCMQFSHVSQAQAARGAAAAKSSEVL